MFLYTREKEGDEERETQRVCLSIGVYVHLCTCEGQKQPQMLFLRHHPPFLCEAGSPTVL